MRRGMTLTWALALVLGLATLTRADEDEDKPAKPAKTGNWFTRLFVRDKKAADTKKEESITPAPLSPAVLRQKAQWELMRRQEVCDKLRQVALQTGDEELRKKADILDQRAWDAYVQRTGGPKNTLTPDEQILDGSLGWNAAQRSRGPASASGSASASFDNRNVVRKD